MKNKLGRNDSCWCGSGIKYKKCHLGRESQEPLKSWEVSKEFRKAFSIKDFLVPDSLKPQCAGTIVKAHTVPKSSSLKRIARDGHVYAFIPSLENLIKYKGRLQPQLVGIDKASTFTGFCAFHDNRIFAPLENQAFVGSAVQCFLLAYRALAREIYTKKALVALSNVRNQADRGKPFERQLDIQAKNTLLDLGASAGMSDNEHHKALYDNVLLNKDFSNVHAYIIELEKPPPIMCSAGVFPEQDFNGNQLQDISDLEINPHLLTFTSFYGGQRGAIVFTWLSESDSICRKFIDSMIALPSKRLTDGLIRFFFEFSENLHLQPDWWEKLSDSKRTALVDRLSASANMEIDRNPGCLVDDGIQFDIWAVSDSRSIGF